MLKYRMVYAKIIIDTLTSEFINWNQTGMFKNTMESHQLSLDLLGPVKLAVNAQLVESGLWAKSLGLLAYLAEENRLVHQREILAELLWPDKPKGAALTSLRQAISQLQKIIPSLNNYLHITSQTIQFRNECWKILDTAQFNHLVNLCDQHVHMTRCGCLQCAKRLEQAIDLYQGHFMSGFFIKGSSEFEAWLEMKRQIYHQIAISALADTAEYYLDQDQYDLAQQVTLRQIEMDSYCEIAHRQYMRSLMGSGQRAAAIKHFENFQKLLRTDLGVSPEPESILLYEQIRGESNGDSLQPGSIFNDRLIRLSPAPGIQSAPMFVGRKKELTFLNIRLQEVIKGHVQFILVAGEAGWGKTALIDAFTSKIRKSHPNIITAYGKGNAYTGIGDPYLPFRDILGFLTGDVETRWAAGAISQELSYRVWKMLPSVAKAIMDVGIDLIDVFVSGKTLLRHVTEVFTSENAQEPDWVEHLRFLLEREDNQRSAQSPVIQKNLFDQFTRVLTKIADLTALILILDDMQWMDAGSVSLLFHLGKRLTHSRILLIGAYRPTDLRTGSVDYLVDRFEGLKTKPTEADFHNRHPLEYVISELKRDHGNIEITLSQGEEGFTDALVDCYPNMLGQSFRARFWNLTQGHPLTAVEMLKSMLDSGGLVKDRSGCLVEGDALDWGILPARIEALIKERLDRLPKRLRNILTAASVEGEYFTAETIAHALKIDEEEIIQTLRDEIGKERRLVCSVSIYWQPSGQRLSKYRFDHILFQKYLYASLDPIERYQWHAGIGAAMEYLFRENIGEMAVQLSWHFESAGNHWKAVHYLNMAGEKALRLSANQEAVLHFEQALRLLEDLPDTSYKTNLELALQINLAVSVSALKGYADAKVGQAFSRAYELCKLIGDARKAFPIVWQLACYRSSLADFTGGASMMQELIELGEQTGEPLLIALGHWGMGWSNFWVGDYISSQQHLAFMINYYDTSQHSYLAYTYSQDPGATSRSILALDLLALGYPHQAAQIIQESIEMARQINHPHTLALSLAYSGMIYGFTRQYSQLLIIAEELIEVTRKNEFVYWYSAGLHQKGWALSYLGQAQEGILLLSQALSILHASEAEAGKEILCLTMAEILSQHGRASDGLELINRQITSSQKSSGLFFISEQLRVRAEALLALGSPKKALAEAAYLESIQLARTQSARFLELKSSLGLARLWADQKTDQAWAILTEIYGQFTEGFDLPDLKAARQLLEELGQRRSQ